MFSLSRRLFLRCANRASKSKWLASGSALDLDDVNPLPCTVHKRTKKSEKFSLLFTPAPVKPQLEDSEAGEELAGALSKTEIVKVINTFYRTNQLKILAAENNLDDFLLQHGFASFRKYCVESTSLPPDLHVLLSDIRNGHLNHLDLFPFFLSHLKKVFPHLEYMEDLKRISDLTNPSNWYPEARSKKRKIHFHCGPTNSGKTYHAIQKFFNAKSGIYLGPLKLLAVEVFNKSNDRGTPCDLVTGEEIIHINPDGEPSNHVSSTIEMCSLENRYDVAVIDEVQMIRDPGRGWAWTRALLGLKADEIHICGEEAAIEIIDGMLCTTNEELEVHKYNRLTTLKVDRPVNDFKNVQPGDCIVCFNRNDIYFVTQALEEIGVETAVIYGALPPGTKLNQCQKFNDPNDPCKVLVATDAIGMGLNLSIRRIIFYSLMKPVVNAKGEKEKSFISVSQALQIAGRAGRYGTKYDEGLVTTFKSADLPVLRELLNKEPDPVLAAGLLPTLEQIELFSFYLPNSSLANLMEIFINLTTIDNSIYFICNLTEFMNLAKMLEHISLPLKTKYVFCCSPISTKKDPFPTAMLLKYAKLVSENEAVTLKFLLENLNWPFKNPKTIRDLARLEASHEVLDLYLWLSYRFPEYFPDGQAVKEMQKVIDLTIYQGVDNMISLVRNMQGTGKGKEGPKRDFSIDGIINDLNQGSDKEKTDTTMKRRTNNENGF